MISLVVSHAIFSAVYAVLTGRGARNPRQTAGLSGFLACSAIQRDPKRSKDTLGGEAKCGISMSGDFVQVPGIRSFRGRLMLPGDEGPCPVSSAVAKLFLLPKRTGKP